MIFPLISSAYCLSLDRNKDTRYPLVQAEFDRVGLSVERIECIESKDNRFISFNQSHYNAVKRGYETGKPFAIFEDDVVFDRYHQIEEAANQLPEGWDLLYLGCNFHSEWEWPSRYSSALSLLPNALMSHAIVYNINAAKFVLDNFNPDIITAENPVYDEWLRVNILSQRRSFVLTPMACYQRPNHSDVWERSVDYREIHEHGNKYLKRMV